METRTNRQTGTKITLDRAANQGLDGTWALICEDHSTVVDFDLRSQAEQFRSYPAEWCHDCYQIVRAPIQAELEAARVRRDLALAK